jgi:hypothetical protein
MTFLGLPQTLVSEAFVGVFNPSIVVFALGISFVRQLHFIAIWGNSDGYHCGNQHKA